MITIFEKIIFSLKDSFARPVWIIIPFLFNTFNCYSQAPSVCENCLDCQVKYCEDCKTILADLPNWYGFLDDKNASFYAKDNAILYESYNPIFGPLFTKVAIDNAGDIKNGRLAAVSLNENEAKLALGYTWTFETKIGGDGYFQALGLGIDGNVKNGYSSIFSNDAIQSGVGFSVNYMIMLNGLSFFHDDDLEDRMKPGRDITVFSEIKRLEEYLGRYDSLRCDSARFVKDLNNLKSISEYDQKMIEKVQLHHKRLDSLAFINALLEEYKKLKGKDSKDKLNELKENILKKSIVTYEVKAVKINGYTMDWLSISPMYRNEKFVLLDTLDKAKKEKRDFAYQRWGMTLTYNRIRNLDKILWYFSPGITLGKENTLDQKDIQTFIREKPFTSSGYSNKEEFGAYFYPEDSISTSFYLKAQLQTNVFFGEKKAFGLESGIDISYYFKDYPGFQKSKLNFNFGILYNAPGKDSTPVIVALLFSMNDVANGANKKEFGFQDMFAIGLRVGVPFGGIFK